MPEDPFEELEATYAKVEQEERRVARNKYIQDLFKGIGDLVIARDPSLQYHVVAAQEGAFYPQARLMIWGEEGRVGGELDYFHHHSGYNRIRVTETFHGEKNIVMERMGELNEQDRFSRSELQYMREALERVLKMNLAQPVRPTVGPLTALEMDPPSKDPSRGP